MRSLQELIRPNIRSLSWSAHLSVASQEYKASIRLDANENPYNAPFNRYPVESENRFKALAAQIKGIPVENITLGNGSDELIDLSFRIFCRPQKDNVVAISPTYEMYQHYADLNEVTYRAVILNERFGLSSRKVLDACDARTKIVWLCSPNNPSGNSLEREEMLQIVTDFDGIVIIDEAYSDFAAQCPMRNEIADHPNLIVLNTLSNAWGNAALHLGMAFAHRDIIEFFDRIRPPHPINALTLQQAIEAICDPYEVDKWVRMLLLERRRMLDALRELPICKAVYPTEANFILAKMTDAAAIYEYLVSKRIFVHPLIDTPLCTDCLRISIGTKSENNALLAALRQYGR